MVKLKNKFSDGTLLLITAAIGSIVAWSLFQVLQGRLMPFIFIVIGGAVIMPMPSKTKEPFYKKFGSYKLYKKVFSKD